MKELLVNSKIKIIYEKILNEDEAKYYSYFLISNMENEDYDEISIILKGRFPTYKIIYTRTNDEKQTEKKVLKGRTLDEQTSLTIFSETSDKRNIYKIYDGNINKTKIENNNIDSEVFVSNVEQRYLKEYSLSHFNEKFDEKIKRLAI